MGTDHAASRLRLLEASFLQHPARGTQERGPATVYPAPVPLNLAMIDHISASRQEVIAHVQADATQDVPAPTATDGIYDWWRASTPDLDEEHTLVREAIIYRQGLEHAIEAGDHDVVRPHPCPACGCWGLFWRPAQRRAVCVNRKCLDEDGLANIWSLKRLAYEHIAREKLLKVHSI